jgi:hypothetical protein
MAPQKLGDQREPIRNKADPPCKPLYLIEFVQIFLGFIAQVQALESTRFDIGSRPRFA